MYRSARSGNWNESVSSLSRPSAIRQVAYTTSAIQSLNARHRRAAQAFGNFPPLEALPQNPTPSSGSRLTANEV